MEGNGRSTAKAEPWPGDTKYKILEMRNLRKFTRIISGKILFQSISVEESACWRRLAADGVAVMDAFRFSPELFQTRAEVMETLEQSGFQWLSHYSSVDCLHDLYGIEVCGIREKDEAVAILRILTGMFPTWNVGCLCFKDYGREPGWKAQIYRDKPRERERWVTT